ncbi:MAG: hypothetical protein Q4C81_07090 [Kocuria sp.]|nr:hypothetical protein [Kocuria sp.]
MSPQTTDATPTDDHEAGTAAAPQTQHSPRPTTPTGHHGADAVLQDMEHVLTLPIRDHPGIYRTAHEKLTAVLDAPVNVVRAADV